MLLLRSAELHGFSALIISGGPQSVYGADAPKYDRAIFDLGLPILGICYGMQLINHVHGGHIAKKGTREDGQFAINVLDASSLLFHGLPACMDVLLTHGDSLDTLAPGFVITATSASGIVTAIEHKERAIYGVQSDHGWTSLVSQLHHTHCQTATSFHTGQSRTRGD